MNRLAGIWMAGVCLALCGGCVTDGTSMAGQAGGVAIGAVQTVVDAGAAKAGLTPYVAPAREALAEAEARKVGRTLLPRGLDITYDAYYEGRLIDPARIQRVPRLTGAPQVVVVTNTPAATTPDPVTPADPPPAGAADDDDAALDRAEKGGK